MRKAQLITVMTLIAVALAAAWWVRITAESDDQRSDATQPPESGVALQSERSDFDASSVSEAERDRALDTYYEPLRFREAIAAFLTAVPQRSTAENQEALAELSNQVRTYQQQGYLALPQARYLEGTLISAVYENDPIARAQALETLNDEYADLSEKPSTTHLDARFEAYKVREAEIVREVLDSSLPTGMTRDEWLRERLDALRNEVYSDTE
ncbi:MAG: hypothetical protein AAGL69_03790 [Pseudomonadota bacterium]